MIPKVTPAPNAVTGSGQGSSFLFGFWKKRSFYRKITIASGTIRFRDFPLRSTRSVDSPLPRQNTETNEYKQGSRLGFLTFMWVLKKGLSFENIETTIVLGTTRVRIFPLYSMRNIDPLLQRRGPKPVNFYKHLSWSFPDFGGGWEAKRRFPANGSEEPSPGVSKDAFDASS